MLSRFLNAHAEFAVDPGTANTVIFARHRGVVAMEPSVVALRRRMGAAEVVAVGRPAWEMLGRTHPGLRAVHPIAGGTVADFESARVLLSHLLRQQRERRQLRGPAVLVSTPAAATPVERRALTEVMLSAGAHDARLADEPVAAAIGAGLDVLGSTGALVIDVGAGKTEVAVLCLGGVVRSAHCPLGGDAMDEAIQTHLRRVHNLYVGPRTAERVKIELGSAVQPASGRERRLVVAGYDSRIGGPGSVEIGESEIADCLEETLQRIVDTIVEVTGAIPAELAADLIDSGFTMTGGASQLRNLDARLARETGMRVALADDPAACVAIGMGRLLDGSLKLLPRNAA